MTHIRDTCLAVTAVLLIFPVVSDLVGLETPVSDETPLRVMYLVYLEIELALVTAVLDSYLRMADDVLSRMALGTEWESLVGIIFYWGWLREVTLRVMIE